MIDELDYHVNTLKYNKDDKEIFTKDYLPFIRSIAAKTFKRYLQYGHDDELSEALIAFNEAIDKYDPSKGHFLPFSAWVIKRRLIDHIRKKKKPEMISIDTYDQDDDIHIDSLDHLAVLEYKETLSAEYRRYEIQEFIELLKKHDISLEDMYNTSPKHKKNKRIVTSTVKYIISDDFLISEIKQNSHLPLKLLVNNLNVPRKTLENSRKYILGTVLLRTGEFEYLNSYLGWEDI